MKMTSIFKKASVIAIAITLILFTVVSILPAALAEDSSTSEQSTTDHGEKLSASNVSLSGSITMMFYFTGLDEWKDSDYIQITVPKEDGSTVTTEKFKNQLSYDETKNRWLVEVPVAYAQQNDVVKMQWFKDGVGGKIRTKTVRNYYDKVVEQANKGSQTHANLVAPLKSMLNCGAMAQTMFEHNDSNLANDGLYASGSNPVNDMTVEHFYDVTTRKDYTEDNNGTGVEFLGGSALLQNTVSIKIYFNCPDNVETAKIYKGDMSKNDTRTIKIKVDEDGRKFVTITNIIPTEFDVRFTVLVNGAKFEYSVLDYALDTLEYYLATDAQKNTARALYLFYTNMKDYTDASYTPGPKEKDQNGNIVTDESGKPVVIECSCERSHFEGESIICSDCGKTLSATATTKITVTAVTTGTIQAGTPANIVVTYAITNAADLEALSLTSKFDDVTVGLKYVDKSVVNGKEGYQCTVDKNVVIEATKGTFSDDILATVTYTVTANVPGIYKLSTVIREAANAGGSVDVSNFITNTPSIEVKSAGCETHKLEYVNKGDTHTVHCPECEQIIKYSEEHSYTEHYSDNGNIRTYTNECICGCNSYEYTIKLATDAEGNVIAPNVIITAADLVQMRDPVRMGGADLAADGSYVTFKNDTTATLDGYFMAVKDGDITEPSGQYMMIKYRTTYNKGWEVFIGANNGNTGATGGIDNFTISAQTNGFNGGVIADGEWHVVIIDLATINTWNGIKPEDDGTYLIDYMRFDIFNTASTDAQTVDVAYIAFADSKEKLTGVDDMNDYVYSDKYSGGTVGYPMNAITDNPYFDPTIIAKKGASYSGTVIKDTVNNNMPFARLTLSSSAPKYFYLWSSASNKIVDSGSYIGILYRENGRDKNDWFKFYINSTSNDAVTGFSANLNTAYCDGNWRFGLIDLSAVIEEADITETNYYDPATGIASLRFDLGNVIDGVTVDIAFVAMFDSEDQAYEYMGSYATNYLNVEGGQGCKHDATAKSADDCCTYCRYCGAKTAEADHTADTKWSPVIENDGNADGKLYEAKLCTVCGGQVDVREAQVRYSLNSKTSETSAYKVYVKGWAAVNGGIDRYVYRVIDENDNVSAWKPVTEGSPIANLTDEDTAYIDAIEGSQLGLADYYANVFFTGGIYAYIDEYAGQSVKVEFGAVPANNPGTEDAPNVISIYTSSTAITAINNTNFRAQFQGIKVGTTSLTSSSVANVVNHFDLSATPLTSANSINFYGWFIAESGTKNYKICVIDEDGKQTYVEFPADDGMLDNTGLESIARGAALDLNTSGDANCRKGAKFDCSAGIDLSDYAGQTVTVEFYAETNNGKTILIADFTNVQVACDHAKNTNSNYVTLTNDPQHEHLICSICEEKIDTRFVSTVKEGLTFFNPSTLNSCVINHVTASSGAENGLDYFRVTLTRNGEGYIFLTNGPVLTGVSNYVAMMVRRPQAATYSVEIFVTPAGTEEISSFTSNSQNLIQSSDWQLVIFDANVLSSVINKETGIGCTRLDIFNTNTAAIGDIADVAWVGFFDSAADAYALFNAYSVSYNNASDCTHDTTAKSAYDCCTYCLACGKKTVEAAHTTEWTTTADGKYEELTCSDCGVVVSRIEIITELGSLTASVEEGDTDGSFYKYTATTTGIFTVKYPKVNGINYQIVINNSTTSQSVTSASAVNGYLSVAVSAGDELLVQVVAIPDNTDPSNPVYPAFEAAIDPTLFWGAYGEDLIVRDKTAAAITSRDSEGYLVVTNTAGGDVNIRVINGVSTPGRYVAVTYKTTDTDINNIYMSGTTADGTAIDYANAGEFVTIKDNEWHTVVVDIYAVLGEGATLNLLRFDVCEDTGTSQTITFKGVEFHDDLNELCKKLNTPVWGLSGTALVPASKANATYSHDENGELVVKNGVVPSDNKDNYVTFINDSVTLGRYIVLTVKANTDKSLINTIHLKDSVYKSFINCGGADIQTYAGEWCTVIVDTEAFMTAGSNIYMLRVDCCKNGSAVGDSSINFKSVEIYTDLDMALASAGENTLFTMGFTVDN